MRRDETARQMRRDCVHYNRESMRAALCSDLMAVAAPTVTAWLVGDMADSLLALDGTAIQGRIIPFLCAVVLTVVATPLLELWKNLLMTREGFAYNGYLMGRVLHMPLPELHRTQTGGILQRLVSDSGEFISNQIVLRTRPPVLLLYIGLFGLLAWENGTHPLFCAALVAFSALPLIRGAYIGKKQAELKKETSEYAQERKNRELELFSARDFLHGFRLDSFQINRLRKLFGAYMEHTGKAKTHVDAVDSVLDFLSGFGAQLGVILTGTVMIPVGWLTPGGLLAGYLMLSAVAKGCRYAKWIVVDTLAEDAHLSRMEFFYSAAEETTAPAGPTPRSLEVRCVTFSYDGQKEPALKDFSLRLDAKENIRLSGPNGSGKSTLAALLGGLYPVRKGGIYNGAGDTMDLNGLRRAVSFCEQDGAVFSGTVEDNLFLPAQRLAEGGEILECMGFTKPLEFRMEAGGQNLSPGERKKLLLARALLKEAPFLILDEPLNHLDEHGRTALVRLLEERNSGIVFISHQELLPAESPVRVVVMEST